MDKYWCHYCNWKSAERPNGMCPKCKTDAHYETIKPEMCQWCNERESVATTYICEECKTTLGRYERRSG